MSIWSRPIASGSRRIVAFCEKRGDDWTLEHLEDQHWECLYEKVLLHADASVVAMRSDHPRLGDIRVRCAEHASTAEELIPLLVLSLFFSKHGDQAATPHQSPVTTLVEAERAIDVVEAYVKVLRGRTLPTLGSRCLSTYGN